MSTKTRTREQAQKGIYEGLKESISEYSEEVIAQTASDIEDAVYQYFENNEHNKKYNEKILFLKMRIKGSRNTKVRSVLLLKKIDLKELIELKGTDFTDEFFNEKLGQTENSTASNSQVSNNIQQLNDQQEQEKKQVPPPAATNPFSSNPFQRAIPTQSNAAANRIGGKSRYVNPNQANQQQVTSINSSTLPPTSNEPPKLPPSSEIPPPNIPPQLPPTINQAPPTINQPPSFIPSQPPVQKEISSAMQNQNQYNVQGDINKQDYQNQFHAKQNEINTINKQIDSNNNRFDQIKEQDNINQIQGAEQEGKKETKTQVRSSPQKPIVPAFHAPPPPPMRQSQKPGPQPPKNEQQQIHHQKTPSQTIQSIEKQAAIEPFQVTNQPPQVTHQPPQVTHQPPQVTHQPPQVTHQPPQVTHQPTQIAHQPPQVIHQSPQVPHQPHGQVFNTNQHQGFSNDKQDHHNQFSNSDILNNYDKFTHMINDAVKSVQSSLLQEFEMQKQQQEQINLANKLKIDELERKQVQSSQFSQNSTIQSLDNYASIQQFAILESNIIQLTQTISQQQTLITNLENQIQNLNIQQQLNKSSSENKNSGSSQSSNQINAVELEQYTNIINNLQQDNVELRNQLNASRENENQNKMTIQKMTVLIDQLQSQNNQLQEKNEQLGSSTVQLNHSFNELQQVNQLQTQQIQQFTQQQLQLQQQIQQLQQQLQQQHLAIQNQQVISHQHQQSQSNQQQQHSFQTSPPNSRQMSDTSNQILSQALNQQNSSILANNNSNVNQMSNFEAEDFFDSLNGSQVVQNNLQSSKIEDSQRNSIIQGHQNTPLTVQNPQNNNNNQVPVNQQPSLNQIAQATNQINQKPISALPQHHQNIAYNQNQALQQQQLQQSYQQPAKTFVPPPAPVGGVQQKQRRVAKGLENMFN